MKSRTISQKQERYFSVRPSSSMAEENQVKNFNLFHGSQNFDSLLPTNEPQRIELPIFFNTPIRNNKVKYRKLANKSVYYKSNDQSFEQNASTVSGVRQNSTEKLFALPNLQQQPKLEAQKVQKIPMMNTYLSAMRRLKDYELLAFACKRAGKQRDEGRAYFSMGILYDNLAKWNKAIEQYKKFLEVCKLIGDIHGEGLAYNCLGVDYHLLSKENSNLLSDAIQFHQKHEEVSDINGKFIASINLGLCYDQIEDQKQSLFHYQNALKYSIKMSNLVGQSIAIGNIGKIGTKGLYDNTDKMKTFIERYLKLAQELSDVKGVARGHVKLGMISANRGNYNDGKENFMRALELTNYSDTQMYTQAKCGFAVSNAECTMEQHLFQFGQSLKKQ